MVTFAPDYDGTGNNVQYTFYIVNNSSNTGFYYNFDQISNSGCPPASGIVAQGETMEVSFVLESTSSLPIATPTLEFGAVTILNVNNTAIPIYFWSGSDGQYINFATPYPGNFAVTEDTSSSNVISGSAGDNNYSIYINGGGQPCSTQFIYFQLYDA
jgi:hypothetical protein